MMMTKRLCVESVFAAKASMLKIALCCAAAVMFAGCEQAADTMDEVEKAASDAAEGTKEAVDGAADKAGDMAKEAGAKLSEGFAAASEKAQAALADVEGGGEILTKIKDLFSKAQESLKGVTDKESAEAAVAKLGDLGGMADNLAASIEKLPEGARTAVAGMIEQGMAHLKTLAEKLQDTPAVHDVIKPKLDALMDKLKKLAGD